MAEWTAAAGALTDVDIVSLTLWGEARGEPVEGRIAIACVIRNRVQADLGHDQKPDWWGEGYRGVCLRPYQFSCWNQRDPNRRLLDGLIADGLTPDVINAHPVLRECYWIAEGVIGGRVLRRVGNATHYHADTMRVPPRWSIHALLIAKCGHHLFFSEVP